MKTTVTVHGMSCHGCENNVEFAVGSLAGVAGVNADHQAKVVEIDFDAEALSVEQIRSAIEDLGYRVPA
jgi:copper ion binding protein